jgi:hypothetical protein
VVERASIMTSDKAKRRHLKRAREKDKYHTTKYGVPASWWCPYDCPHLSRYAVMEICKKGLTRNTCKRAHDRRAASKRSYDPFKQEPE